MCNWHPIFRQTSLRWRSPGVARWMLILVTTGWQWVLIVWLLSIPSAAIRQNPDLCFYRVTLCVSVIFAVALSVRLSVTHICVLYPDSWRYQISFSTRYPNHSSFFVPKRQCPIPRKPLQRGHKIHMVWKICDFRPKSPFSWNWYEI